MIKNKSLLDDFFEITKQLEVLKLQEIDLYNRQQVLLVKLKKEMK